MFTDWVDLVSPLLEFMSVEADDYVSHKRFLALFSGGMLPIISLSFLHMLVKFTEEDRVKEEKLVEEEHKTLVDKHIIEDEIEKYKQEHQSINAPDLMSEISRIRLSEADLKILEEALLNPPAPNENLINAKKRYDEFINANRNIDTPVVENVTADKQTETQIIEDKQEENVDSLDESGSSDDNNISDTISADNNQSVEPLVEEPTIENIKYENDAIVIPDDFIPEPEDLGLFEPSEEILSDLPNEIEKKN
jgi:hypothetical protein